MNQLFSAAQQSSLYAILIQAFSGLRDSWQGDWMGLNHVLKSCQEFLLAEHADFESSDARTLMACALSLSEHMESTVETDNEPH